MSRFKKFELIQDQIRALDFSGKSSSCNEVFELYKLRNSFGLPPDTKIHRIFQKDFLQNDMSNGYLTLPLASPDVWNDDLENPFVDVVGIDKETGWAVDYGSLVRSFYALCWTDRPIASDKDWDSFSYGKPAVRITTTVGKLLDRLISISDPSYMNRTWLIKVEYLEPSLIHSMKKPEVVIDHAESTGSLLSASAAVVRKEYSGEDEVRLIIDASVNPDVPGVVKVNKGGSSFIRIPFRWDGFVDDKIEFDLRRTTNPKS
ncbi:MAG: hypothetical protein ABII63_07385 [Pseudomonadota bacterium]